MVGGGALDRLGQPGEGGVEVGPWEPPPTSGHWPLGLTPARVRMRRSRPGDKESQEADIRDGYMTSLYSLIPSALIRKGGGLLKYVYIVSAILLRRCQKTLYSRFT